TSTHLSPTSTHRQMACRLPGRMTACCLAKNTCRLRAVRCARCGQTALQDVSVCAACGYAVNVGSTPTQASSRLRPSSFLVRHTRGGWDKGLVSPPAPPVPPSPLDEARRSAADLLAVYRSLVVADRWAAGASAALLLALILPWQWTKDDDEVMGLVAAWPVAVLAA